jgi:hypothetical protein
MRSPVTRDTIGAHEHGLDSTNEGFGLRDELTVTCAKDDVGFHGVRLR